MLINTTEIVYEIQKCLWIDIRYDRFDPQFLVGMFACEPASAWMQHMYLDTQSRAFKLKLIIKNYPEILDKDENIGNMLPM